MRYDSDAKYLKQTDLSLFANTNAKLLKEDPKGLVLEFPGLGGGSCLGGSPEVEDYCTEWAQICAESGVLLAYLNPGPWSWMNDGAVRYADDVVEVLREACGLSGDSPLVLTGGSMGGSGSLVYAAKSRHRITACVSHCPCCDMEFCYARRPGFPRSFLSAVAGYDCSYEEGLRAISPCELVDRMQDIPYLITIDGEDGCFPVETILPTIEHMRARGLDVRYEIFPGLGHGDFTPEGLADIRAFVLRFAANP